MNHLVLCLLVLAGCDDGDPDRGERGVCAGRPCRTSITSADAWAAVSAPHDSERCDFAEHTKYLAPATESAALQEIVFHDVKVHRLHLDFMSQVLTEYFGGLPAQTYQELVQRRASRQYWAGAIFQLRDADGGLTGYGFDVIVDPTSAAERLTEDEIATIEAALETRFQLPLVYAPTTRDAIAAAAQFTRVATHMPRSCHIVSCTDASKDCLVVPQTVSLCGQFLEGRSVEVEHARKARLAAVPGAYALPREVGTHAVPPVFGAGELGPARIAITPVPGDAAYQVRKTNGHTSREYRQSFHAGTQVVELSWEIRLPPEGGGFVLAEPQLQDTVQAYAVLDGSQRYEDMILLSSCKATTLDRWRARGALPGGDGFEISIRRLVADAGSGPMFVTSGEVTLAGQLTVVDDYFRLVYAGEHHNWNNQFWVLFDVPVTYAGHAVHGLWIDEQAYGPEVEAAWTLGPNLQPLDPLTVSSYVVEKLP